MNELNVITRPAQPDSEDCCGDGCTYCVHDLYEDDVKKYVLFLRKKIENDKTFTPDLEDSNLLERYKEYKETQ